MTLAGLHGGTSATDVLAARAIRTDIQALRAIAVIGVVLYHGNVPGFSGGYIGVDVFFVISGYLITGLLLRELQNTGCIALGAFWARRAWRLLPSALLVLSATMALSRWYLSPIEHWSVSQDILSTLVYLANYRFAARAVDYFDHDQATSPVLHFWSLSVEEQFYVFLPLLLLAVFRLSGRKRHLFAAMAVALLVSFVVSLLWMAKSQPAAFFHTEARIWQLAAGGLLAFVAPESLSGRWRGRALLAGSGLAVILACMILLNDRSPYPGWYALTPVAATVAVVASGPHLVGPLGDWLAARPLQWLGKTSYSIYLWHWPILLFLGPHLPAPVTFAIVLLVSALAFALVEEPLRNFSGRDWPLWQRLGTPALASLATALLAVALLQTPWLQRPETAAIVARIVAAKADGPRMSTDDCTRGWATTASRPCTYGDPRGSRTVVLFGDSYAEHLFDGLQEAARNAGWKLEVWTRAACPPISATILDEQRGGPDVTCNRWRDEAMRQLKAKRPDLVVVSSWTGASDRILDEVTATSVSRQSGKGMWRQGFISILEEMQRSGLSVAVVPNTPRGRFRDLASCIAKSAGDQCGMARHRAIPGEQIDKDAAVTVPGVHIIDLADRFCGSNVCYSVKDDVIVYRDHAHHLTASFSKRLAPAFAPLFDKAR